MDQASLGRILRFLVVGSLNTAITYGVYLALLIILKPWAAYAWAYALGIGIAFIANRMWVFRSDCRWTAILPYTVLQLLLLGVGSLVSFAVTGILPAWAVGLAAIAVIVPLSYGANSFVLRSTQASR